MTDGSRVDVKEVADEVRRCLRQDIVGLDETITLLLASIFSSGHCLLVGVPGLAKTLLISTISRLLDLKFSRIQFTPDLMPSDITGAEVIVEDRTTGERKFEFIHGPLFANIVLADEINRTPPKTQASLMEAMEEHQVSSLGHRFEMDKPFFVLATQNPIEQEGTYPLPTSQLDRFFFEVKVDYPSGDEELEIIRMTTQPRETEQHVLLSQQQVLDIIARVKSMEAPANIINYATKLARISRPDDDAAPDFIKKFVSYGAGPRAAQALVLGAKSLALMRGAVEPRPSDVRDLVLPVFRHRVVMNFLGTAEGLEMDDLLQRLVDETDAPDRPGVKQTATRKRRGLLSFFSKR